MKNNSFFEIRFVKSNEIIEKEKLTLECLEIANNAKFPTDFNDVYEHLFTSDYICLAYFYDKLVAFSVFAMLKELNNLHIHGLIVDPEFQGKGISKKMIKKAVDSLNFKYLTGKTHNPRMFQIVSTFACSDEKFFPNFKTEIPSSIRWLVSNNNYISNSDMHLIVRNAYPDEKIVQSANNHIQEGFCDLGKYDAQVIVVVIKK